MENRIGGKERRKEDAVSHQIDPEAQNSLGIGILMWIGQAPIGTRIGPVMDS
jgi:hypothetical protein